MSEDLFELGPPASPPPRRLWITWVSGATALAVAVAVGTWALSHHDKGSDRLASTRTTSEPAAPTPDPEPTTAAPSPSSTPQPSQTPSEVAQPSPRSTHDSGSSYDDGLGPRSPGSVTVPYTPGQHSWSGTSEGIHLTMSMSPTSPRTGEVVTFHLSASGPDADCCGIYIVWGDGQVDPDNGVDCQSGLGDGSTSVTWQHVYNKSGRHGFLLQGISNHCNRNGVLYGSLDIAAGTSTSQGPSLPEVVADSSTPPAGHENDPSYLSLYGHARDRDGHLSRLVVSWGDGTTQTFDGDPMACQKTRDGWPGPSEAGLPGEPPPAHHYTKPGSYVVTITAYSTGCDGKDAQKGHASFTHAFSPPQTSDPEPTPTPTG